jgi:cytochrome oxidase Cu insertion factor (SCO1/SenC/PrrC family)
MGTPAFDGATPIADILAYVDSLRAVSACRDGLVDLLAEQAPLYAGCSTVEAEWLRGYLLASFETTGLPLAAIGYVLEELESGLNPYTVAAAAKALRGASDVPERAVPLLLKATRRIRLSDDRVSFAGCCAATRDGSAVTAVMEVVRTIAWLGPRARAAIGPLRAMAGPEGGGFSAAVRAEIEKAIAAVAGDPMPIAHSCCSQAATASGEGAGPGAPSPNIEALELEDQDSSVLTFGTFPYGRPSVVTFFYTRCMNPEKCSLTVTKLAHMQKRIGDEGLHGRVNIAAFTYDPAFDLPRRLRAYGSDRGMSFDAHNRMLRTTGPFEPLRQHFDLGVGYGPATVNRHRIDLFVLDPKGEPIFGSARRLWDEAEVFDALKAAL